MFTGPNDEQQEKLLKEPDEDIEKYGEKLTEYQEENFKPYMSERFL